MATALSIDESPFDIAVLGRYFAKALRSENKSARTIDTYLEAVNQMSAGVTPNPDR